MGNKSKALALVTFGAAACAGGIYVGETDDAPGAAVLGILLLIGTVAWSIRLARRTT